MATRLPRRGQHWVARSIVLQFSICFSTFVNVGTSVARQPRYQTSGDPWKKRSIGSIVSDPT